MALRALLFDFDGLILDTETSTFESTREAFANHGVELSREWWQGIIGGADHPHWLDVLSARLAEANSFDASARLAATRAARDRRKLELLEAEVVLPGVEALLEEAAGEEMRCAVVSSSPASWVIPHLERLGLAHRFEVVVCRDDVDGDRARTKPAPDLYLVALERLRVAPEEAVALEDSPQGVVAANAAGLRCVAVPCGLTSGLAFPGAAAELVSLAGCSLAVLRALSPPPGS